MDMLKNLSHNYICSLITEANQIAELQGTRTINQEQIRLANKVLCSHTNILDRH